VKFKELQKEGLTFKKYEYLKSSLALNNQLPIRIIRIDNIKTSKILIIKQAQTGIKAITTRQFNIPLEDAPFFTAWFSQDFPDTPLDYLKNKAGGNNGKTNK
jgi:DNA repair photolyase